MFRLGWWAKPPSWMKPWDFNPISRRGDTWLRRVRPSERLVASPEQKWLTTLTGENPTSSARQPTPLAESTQSGKANL